MLLAGRAGRPDDAVQPACAGYAPIDWVPYQRKTFVTPPFAGFTSGHSTFSRAAAEVLTRFTGAPYFPGGLGEFDAPQNALPEVRDRPERADVAAAVGDLLRRRRPGRACRASAAASTSRADDFNGRIMGSQDRHRRVASWRPDTSTAAPCRDRCGASGTHSAYFMKRPTLRFHSG